MRINNPKSFAGFALGDSADSAAYKLATVGQVSNEIKKLNDKFTMLLTGRRDITSGYYFDENGEKVIVEGAAGSQAGYGGLVNEQGYAWLNHDGKIDASLLPSLAITETYVVEQKEFIPDFTDGTEWEQYVETVSNYVQANSIYTLLEDWVNRKIESENLRFQKGDIFIVTPNAIVKNNPSDSYSLTTKELAAEEEEALKKIINPAYSGTYIVTDIRKSDSTGFKVTFAKMAYTDSNIVTINGLSPNNSTGMLSIELADILKMRATFDSRYAESGNIAAAEALQDTLYRAATVLDDNGSYRFAFIDNAVGSPTENQIVKYAKLSELNKEVEDREAEIQRIESLANDYKAALDRVDADLSTDIAGIHETLGTRNDDTVIPTDGMRNGMNAPVFDQLAALRYDVDWNAEVLHKTKVNTNALLTQIQSNVNSLFEHLDGKAVAILEKQFNWVSGAVTNTIPENEAIPIENVGVVQGSVLWTYDYVSPTVNDAEVRLSPNALAGLASEYENADEARVDSSLLHTSQERILAVFDPEGNKVEVDIRSYVDNTNKYHQVLSIQTDWFGNGNEHNSILAGNWTMLISKTIIGIENNTTPTIKVGDTNEKHYQNRGVQEIPAD